MLDSSRLKKGLDGEVRPAGAALGFLLAGLLAGLAPTVPALGTEGGQPEAAEIRLRPGWNADADSVSSDVAVAWFDALYGWIRAEAFSPLVASRTIGYAGVTLYEAVVPGMPGHRSLGGQLNELSPLPAAAPGRRYHWPTVANSALAGVLRGLFAGGSEATREAIDALEEELAAGFRAVVPLRAFALSQEQGRAVAEAVLDWAAGDGFAVHDNCDYSPPIGPGLWVRTPPALLAPLQPCWGRLRPFALPAADHCLPPEHPEYSTESDSDFYKEGFEVYQTTAMLDEEQRAIALFWADNPGLTGTPPGHWISILGQIARADDLSLAEAAEGYARVGIGVADAFISCWHAKYFFNLLRPITYIRELFDPEWLSPIPTPPFPEYTSGHSVQSGAASFLLEDQLGEREFVDDTHAPIGLPSRAFGSFAEAAEEAAISRLYGGIHFSSGIQVGIEQGRCVGRAILDQVEFRCAPEDEDSEE